jgi:hypothetical protein
MSGDMVNRRTRTAVRNEVIGWLPKNPEMDGRLPAAGIDIDRAWDNCALVICDGTPSLAKPSYESIGENLRRDGSP